MTVDGSNRPKSHRLERGSVVVVELPAPAGGLVAGAGDGPARLRGRAPCRRRQARRHRGAPGRRYADRARSPAQLADLGRRGWRGSRPAGHRPSARPRHIGAARRRALRGGVCGACRQAIRRREVERRYLALVRGRPRSRTGRIDAPIGRDRRDPTRRSLDTDEPRDAVTWFEVVETLPEHALLDVKLETGRTHQIRVHLAAIDLPVSGDPTYGARATSASSGSSSMRTGCASPTRSPGTSSTLASPLPARPQCRADGRLARRPSAL